MTGPRRETYRGCCKRLVRALDHWDRERQLIRAAATLSGFSFARGASMSRPLRQALGSDETGACCLMLALLSHRVEKQPRPAADLGVHAVSESPLIGCNPMASSQSRNPHRRSKSGLHVLIAMQKVVGSSPISRLREARFWNGFFAL
jgi:hypothetical protein